MVESSGATCRPLFHRQEVGPSRGRREVPPLDYGWTSPCLRRSPPVVVQGVCVCDGPFGSIGPRGSLPVGPLAVRRAGQTLPRRRESTPVSVAECPVATRHVGAVPSPSETFGHRGEPGPQRSQLGSHSRPSRLYPSSSTSRRSLEHESVCVWQRRPVCRAVRVYLRPVRLRLSGGPVCVGQSGSTAGPFSSVGRSVGPSVSRSVSWSVGQSVSRSTPVRLSRSSEPDSPWVLWTQVSLPSTV